jgi:sigma-B regulation protein RsbU (phosphoserine phosphatase)
MSAHAASESLVDLRVPARPDRLKLIRSCVADACAIAGLSRDCTQDLVHAADEACQNIIRHGYGDAADGDISLRITHAHDRVTLTLTDTAPPAPPDAIAPRTSTSPERGGLGTRVISACVDDVALTRGPDGRGNQLTLTKWIPE